eukprot:gene28485-34389_t
MFFIVSIEPMYSQSVGNYEYLCDSVEKVNFFRGLLRKVAGASIPRDYQEEEDEEEDEYYDYEGWDFFERVYVVDDGSNVEALQDVPDEDQHGGTVCSARMVWKADYKGFHWLKYEMEEIDYTSNRGYVAFDILPKLDHVNDNVEVVRNIPLEQFVRIV